MPEAHTRCTGILICDGEGHESFAVQVEIDCPTCGRYHFLLAGHHLRMLRDALIEFIDQFPQHTGKDSDVQTVERYRTQGTIPEDPTQN